MSVTTQNETETVVTIRCPGCGSAQDGADVLLHGRDRLTGAPGSFEVLACA